MCGDTHTMLLFLIHKTPNDTADTILAANIVDNVKDVYVVIITFKAIKFQLPATRTPWKYEVSNN